MKNNAYKKVTGGAAEKAKDLLEESTFICMSRERKRWLKKTLSRYLRRKEKNERKFEDD